MIVLTTNKTTTQAIRYIARGVVPSSMAITDESTNKTINTNIPLINILDQGYYTQITALFNLSEGKYYRLQLKDSNGNDVYRDRIFCTDQVAANYTPNQNTYRSFATEDNEFLMY